MCFGFFFLFVFTFFFTACGPYVHVSDARPWLHGKDKPAEIDISGQWGSNDWGSANFSQNGNIITGSLGDFTVEGVVSGKDVYLLVTYQGSLHYTAHLSPLNIYTLSGKYSEGGFVDKNPDRRHIKLTSLGKIKSLAFDSDSNEIKWLINSDPADAHVFFKVVSSNNAIPKIEKRYLGNTPISKSNPLKIQGLTKENSSEVSIEIEISKRGYQGQTKIFNCKDIIETKEISWMFELQESDN